VLCNQIATENNLKNRNKLNKIDLDYASGKLNSENYSRIVDLLTDEYLDKGFDLFQNLVYYFDKSDFEQRNSILGSIFKDKMIFDGKIFRTA
jgi:hypothetical protein